ncbi:MAG: sigma-70 family RNA polymerase sigma factor [Acidobacteriia bacterium]|nr:sigma-70 family RNA polymerase sigma factor [Terriglobia bacterium]
MQTGGQGDNNGNVEPEARPEVLLARQLLAGDADAFDRFVDLFRSRIFQYSFLMCGQREDAEEVAQETLLKVFENIDQLREPERVKAWVFQIAKNACLMMRRKSIFAPREEISLDEPGAQIRDAGALPDSEVLRHELHDRLSSAIRELPHMYRAVLLLRDVEELSTGETAKILDLSTDVVKTRLVRARKMIRAKLDAPIGTFEPQDKPRPLAQDVRDDMLALYRRGAANRGRSRL